MRYSDVIIVKSTSSELDNRPFAHLHLDSKRIFFFSPSKQEKSSPFNTKFNENNIYFLIICKITNVPTTCEFPSCYKIIL